jgi:hypothetical protein
VPDAVYIFWGIVGLLAVAAGCNHGWHHVREGHLTTRLVRVSAARERGPALLVADPSSVTIDTDWAPGVCGPVADPA